jgi:uncharacterized protein
MAADCTEANTESSNDAREDTPTALDVFREEVTLQLADGTLLHADLYRSHKQRPAPAILIRTPYGARAYASSPQDGMTLTRMLTEGFAVFIQDVRGTGHSTGTFVPLAHESEDGIETLRWMGRQEWCNGRISTFGASYLGFTQYAMAVVPDAPLAACVFMNTAADAYRDWYYSYGGSFSVENSDRYAFFVAVQQARRDGNTERVQILEKQATKASTRLMDGGWGSTELLAAQSSCPWFEEVLRHPLRDRYWQELSYCERFSQVKTSGLHIGGWFDFFSAATVQDFVALNKRSTSFTTRGSQYLVMGPWTHLSMSGKFPYHDFGEKADALDFGLDDIIAAFLSEEKRSRVLPKVSYFVMGSNEWQTGETWPPAGTEYRQYYLQPGLGDAGARLIPEDDDGCTSHIAVPVNIGEPVPTHGGRLLFSGDNWTEAGPADQRELERRADVVSFTTAAFAQRVDIAGSIVLVANVSTDLPDTDIAVIVTDVAPDGSSRLLCEGLGRLSLREGLDRELAVVAGTIYRLSIYVGVTANAFLAGHRLRINVAGSNFPNHALNPRLQRSGISAGGFVLHTGKTCLSYLTVPISRPS